MIQALEKGLACVFILVLAGCASGPTYKEVKGSIPTLKADQGRIYFYRTANMFGAGIQPSVMLNGTKVGDSIPGGFFYIDQVPGSNEVALTTEVDRKATFTLDAGQIRYVRMTVTLGVIVYRVYPELVDASQGESEIESLSYTGGKATTQK